VEEEDKKESMDGEMTKKKHSARNTMPRRCHDG
jgi:hypothetical protein